MSQISFGTVEHLNIRLGNAEYIGHAADRQYYGDLIREVHKLERAGDKPEIPDVNEPYAWRRLYAIYQKYKARAVIPVPASVQLAMSRQASASASWTDYIGAHADLLRLKGQGVLTPQIIEYLGLHECDLESVVSSDPEAQRYGGKHPDWMDRCARVKHAQEELQSMSRAQVAAVPTILAARRRDAETAALRERVAELEAIISKQMHMQEA